VPGVLDAYHLVDPATGNGLSIAFFEDTVNVADVKAAIGKKASEIGWDDVPRPSPRSEAIYRVLRSGWRFARLTRGVRDQAHGLAGGLVRAL
jgi:hypothetical protein